MPYSNLYDYVQTLTPKISTRLLKQKALELSDLTAIREQWTDQFNTEHLRGAFLTGPMGPPLNLGENEGLIVLARGLNKCWRRFVYTKELMHTFDDDAEQTDKAELLEEQLQNMSVLGDLPPQVLAERKAFWRALGALCPETDRLAFKQQHAAGQIGDYEVALKLKIPEAYIERLLQDNFPEIMTIIK